MVAAMEREAFGACTNFRSCEAVCPKEISISGIARMNKDFRRAVMTGAATAPNGKKR
jgi:succinate dehydrogenase / fumarate reductase iron-sulfur subunit